MIACSSVGVCRLIADLDGASRFQYVHVLWSDERVGMESGNRGVEDGARVG